MSELQSEFKVILDISLRSCLKKEKCYSYSLVLRGLASMCEVLGLISNTEKTIIYTNIHTQNKERSNIVQKQVISSFSFVL